MTLPNILQIKLSYAKTIFLHENILAVFLNFIEVECFVFIFYTKRMGKYVLTRNS